MPFLGSGLGYPAGLGTNTAVTQPTATDEEVRAILVSLFPPGELYDFENSDANVYKLLAGFGSAYNLFGFLVADRLKAEFNPAICVEKVPDWEAALNILPGTGNAKAGKTTAQRQAAIVSKLRESGAATLNNIRAALGPLLGYADSSALEVLEVDRETLRAAHTYTAGGSLPIPGSSTVSRSLYVSDDGTPAAGVFVKVNITHAALSDLTVTLRSPDSLGGILGTSKSWTLPASSSGTDVYLYARGDFENVSVTGTWTLSIVNAGGTTGTWGTGEAFIEGLGTNGLGGCIFYWGAYPDPGLVNSPDYTAALPSIRRQNPAHAHGFLTLALDGWPDETSGSHLAVPDEFLPA